MRNTWNAGAKKIVRVIVDFIVHAPVVVDNLGIMKNWKVCIFMQK